MLLHLYAQLISLILHWVLIRMLNQDTGLVRSVVVTRRVACVLLPEESMPIAEPGRGFYRQPISKLPVSIGQYTYF